VLCAMCVRARDGRAHTGGNPLPGQGGPKTKDPAYYDNDIDLTVFDWFHGKMSSNDAYQLLSTQVHCARCDA
jgi:hypothetical protein